MSASTFHPSSRPPLLEKSTNTILPTPDHRLPSPSKLGKSDMAAVEKRPTFTSCPTVAGQKRSIDEVDTSHHGIKSTSSSFSQARQQEEFFIYEEASQTSIDIEKEISYLRQPAVLSEPQRHKHEENSSSQESLGVSSLLNLSQVSDAAAPPTKSRKYNLHPTRAESVVPTDPVQRQVFIEETTNILLTRIQAAMEAMGRKGNPDLAEFEAHQEALERKKDLDRRLAEYEASYESQKKEWEATGGARGSKIASPLNNAFSKNKIPRLDPSPPLTEHSRATMPSSPPMSYTSGGPAENERTQMQSHANQTPHQGLMSPIQLPSPGNTTGETIIIEQDINCAVEKMIAKTKRGEALDGLMKLMETTSKYDSLDEWTG